MRSDKRSKSVNISSVVINFNYCANKLVRYSVPRNKLFGDCFYDRFLFTDKKHTSKEKIQVKVFWSGS